MISKSIDWRRSMGSIREKYEFRTIKSCEADQAAAIEQICFPPNEACSPQHMKERVELAPELFLVAVEKETGKIAGFLNGLATDEKTFRDEFFTDVTLHQPTGKTIMLLGLDVLPEYRHQGLATALVSEYARLAQAKGKEQLLLTCLEEKVVMYKKMNFIDCGLANSTWGGETWHQMRYVLNPILQTIIGACNGKSQLPETFSLSAYRNEEKIPFADGAMDGIYLFHTQHSQLPEEDVKALRIFVRNVADTECTDKAEYEKKIMQLFDAISQKYPAVQAIDAFENVIYEEAKHIKLHNLATAAIHVLLDSKTIESVKYALMIAEVLNLGQTNKHMAEAIHFLGLCEEFTFFVAFNEYKWEQGQERLFLLVKRTRGWGRIHALSLYEPDTAEKKRWLFTDGWKNNIMPQYSLADALNKAQADLIVQGNLTDYEFQSLQEMMPYLLDENGPLPTLAAVDGGRLILQKYMEHAQQEHKTRADAEILRQVKEKLTSWRIK